jgi:hypothetical protein
MTDRPPCTASITNEHSGGTHHCVLEAGHHDPEWGGDHAGPEDEHGTRYRWSDKAIGALPHQPDIPAAAPAPEPALRDLYAAAIASYDHAVGQATDPAPSDHHHGQADAVLAVRDREMEQLRTRADQAEAAIGRVLAYADRVQTFSDLTVSPADRSLYGAIARDIRNLAALDPQEQRRCRRCQCPAGAHDCTHCNCCDVPEPPELPHSVMPCKCGHSRSAHNEDGCTSCQKDGHTILWRHPHINPQEES